jgi:hypothetical protein
MVRLVLIEEFHVAVRVSRGLPDAEYAAIRRTLDAKPFRAALGRAVRGVFRRYPSLNHARVAVSR